MGSAFFRIIHCPQRDECFKLWPIEYCWFKDQYVSCTPGACRYTHTCTWLYNHHILSFIFRDCGVVDMRVSTYVRECWICDYRLLSFRSVSLGPVQSLYAYWKLKNVHTISCPPEISSGFVVPVDLWPSSPKNVRGGHETKIVSKIIKMITKTNNKIMYICWMEVEGKDKLSARGR